MQLLWEERTERDLYGMLKQFAAVRAKGERGHDQRGLGDQMAGEAVVAGSATLGDGLVVLRRGFLPVATFMFSSRYLHGGIFVLVQAKGHGLASVALQGQPDEHESKQQAGEEEFHESG